MLKTTPWQLEITQETTYDQNIEEVSWRLRLKEFKKMTKKFTKKLEIMYNILYPFDCLCLQHQNIKHKKQPNVTMPCKKISINFDKDQIKTDQTKISLNDTKRSKWYNLSSKAQKHLKRPFSLQLKAVGSAVAIFGTTKPAIGLECN